MLFACWAAKGGAGATVVSCSLALVLARTHPAGALLVDMAGDAEAVLGCAAADGSGGGLAGWLTRSEAGDNGRSRAASLRCWEVEVGEGLHLLPRGSAALPPTERSPVLLDALAAEERAVVVDCGTVSAFDGGAAWPSTLAGAATHSLLVTRLCYLALRRAVRAPWRASGVVVVSEPGRSLRPADVASVLGVPVVVDLPYDPGVARSVDAGLLGRRLPPSLARAAGELVA